MCNLEFAAKILIICQLCKLISSHLGTWLVFTWELGLFSFGNLDHFHLGTWLVCREFAAEPPIYTKWVVTRAHDMIMHAHAL